MQPQLSKTTTSNSFHFFEYRQLEQFQSDPFSLIIGFADDKVAFVTPRGPRSIISIDTTSTYLYFRRAVESVYGVVTQIAYLSPGHLVTVEKTGNDAATTRLVVYYNVETENHTRVIDVGGEVISIACHNGRIAVSVAGVGILLFELSADVRLIAKICVKPGRVQLHRNYIINYVDSFVTILDVLIVERQDFFKHMGDEVLPAAMYRWNAIDIEVEVYGDKHITHAVTLLQEHISGLQTTLFIPQRTATAEEGVRVVLASQTSLQVFFIDYGSPDVRIACVFSSSFPAPHSNTPTQIVGTPCHVLRFSTDPEKQLSVIDVFPLRKFYTNKYDNSMGIQNENRVNNTTSDLPNLFKIYLAGIQQMVVVNHKIVVVRKFDTDDTPEISVLEPIVSRLCQEISADVATKTKLFSNPATINHIEIAITFKTYYEASVILEEYLNDFQHYLRRGNNNWTDPAWREQLADDVRVVRKTLRQLYSYIAEELLKTGKGELASYFFSKSETPFDYVVHRFMATEMKTFVVVYFDEVYFNADKEHQAQLMYTEAERVFKLLEDDCARLVDLAVHPLFQKKEAELDSAAQIGAHREKLKLNLKYVRKGTPEYEAIHRLDARCAVAQYILGLRRPEPPRAEVFRELAQKHIDGLELETFLHFSFAFFTQDGDATHKEPVVARLEQERPLLLAVLMIESTALAERYLQAGPSSALVRLVAYEKLFAETRRYARELVEAYAALTDAPLEYPFVKEYDARYRARFEQFHVLNNTATPEWVPKEVTSNPYVKKMISVLSSAAPELPETFTDVTFVREYMHRNTDHCRFARYLYATYPTALPGYVADIRDDTAALERVSGEILTFDEQTRTRLFEMVACHLTVRQFCGVMVRAPADADLTPFLKRCISNCFYRKHLGELCAEFPQK